METTAITLAWALHLLATDPDVQHRLQVETDNVLKGEKFDPAHLPSLGLAGRVVTETLRLYPPAWMMTRTVRQDAELGGVRLKAGSTLVLSPYLLHRRPDLYTEPDRFDPDRTGTRHLGFGGSLHYCVGAPLARFEAEAALTALAARLKAPRLIADPPPYRSGAALRGPEHLRVAIDGIA